MKKTHGMAGRRTASLVFAVLSLLVASGSIWVTACCRPTFCLAPLGCGERTSSRRFPSLLNSLWITAEEAAGGLLASIVVGVAGRDDLCAVALAAADLLYPYTILLQTVPIVAIAPLIIMWVGAGILAVTRRDLHHLSCAHHRQHHAGPDQRG